MNKKDLLKISKMNHFAEMQNRARSFTVGTCFGGTVEVSMRRHDGSNTFVILQPVEVTEIIHQLAAGIGCHIHLYPRKDFASWRDWKYTEEELAHYRGVQHTPGVGHAPHPNEISMHHHVGANLPSPEQQPGMIKPEIRSNENAMAIEKPKNRRSIKRSAKAA